MSAFEFIPSDSASTRETWTDKTAYDKQAIKLVQMFRDNFKKFEAHVGADVKAAAPKLAEAAE
ncbi:MAG: hypothetical protein ABL973_14605 [Micropepsaceae bacterium]